MTRIDNLGIEANQITKVILPDGSIVVINLIYFPAIQRWIMNVARDTFSVNGINICLNPNIMRQWKNVIPFGIFCDSVDGVDPIYIDDFFNGRVQLYMLNASDVVAVENQIAESVA